MIHCSLPNIGIVNYYTEVGFTHILNLKTAKNRLSTTLTKKSLSQKDVVTMVVQVIIMIMKLLLITDCMQSIISELIVPLPPRKEQLLISNL